MAWPLIKLLPQKTNFKFVRFAGFAAILSVIAVIGSLFLTLYPLSPPCGGLNCGVDFKGGTAIEVKTDPNQIDLAKLRAIVSSQDLGDVQVQGFGDGKSALVRFETPENKAPAVVVDQVKAKIREGMPGVSFGKTEVVGPKVSGELLVGGVMALGFAVLLMMAYIWFRFEVQFGFGAVVGLLHDVILTFGLFAITGMEFTLTSVAALLTIIGYSMNDTVVVFDRLRENKRKYKKMPLGEMIDLSINETLSRTIITGVTSVMALSGLAILGGEALFSFSIALIFGIVIGTYSSIYVAAPVILLWGVRETDEEAEVVDVGGFKPR